MSRARRKFDFTRFKQRHIALKLLYFGWDCDGLATQVDSKNTIEYHLFQALTTTCLIESREKCGYNRCGRTDKGVSSYGQVVNLNIRSNLVDESDPNNIGLFTPDGYADANDGKKTVLELNYINILNRVLPSHIKAIAWTPVKRDFSSRFSCQGRSYSYIFPAGDLCIKSMQEAISYLIGEHDFRNLCSFDLKHGVINHKRTILEAHVKPASSFDESTQLANSSPYLFYEVVIIGQAFLYHQIRCIMTILFLVGTRKESPSIIKDLLDIKKCSARPNYNRASPMPLCLFDCRYKSCDIPLGWQYSLETLRNLLRRLKNLWLQYKTKSMMIERVLFDIGSTIENEFPESINGDHSDASATTKRLKLEANDWKDFGLECDNMSDKKYIPLLKRPRDETLESKLKRKGDSIDSTH